MSNSILPMPDMTDDIEQGKRNLDVYGVTIHKNFLTPTQVELLRERLNEQAYMEQKLGVATFEGDGEITTRCRYSSSIGKPSKTPKYQAVALLPNKGRAFIDLAKHPVALAYAKHVLRGVQFKVGAQFGFILTKGASAHPLHRDQGPIPFPTPISLTLAVAVALGDHEEDMGATRMIPGSHLWPELESPKASATVPVTMPSGAAALWDGRVWHGQGASCSEKVRYSIVTNYTAHFLSTYECFPASIQDHVYDAMSNDELELFGFEFNGINGRISPRTPHDRRSNIVDRLPYIPELHDEKA